MKIKKYISGRLLIIAAMILLFCTAAVYYIPGLQVEGGISGLFLPAVLFLFGAAFIVFILLARNYYLKVNELESSIRSLKENGQTEQPVIKLHELASRLQAAREEERRLIARELHDELGQALTILKIQVKLLSGRLSEDQTELKEKIDSVSGVIDSTVDSVRQVSAKLRPGMLDEMGLVAALKKQAEDFRSKTGIECIISFPESEPRLGAERSTALFRIFQEALTNAARHSDATIVITSMKVFQNYISLKIEDNGHGISEGEINDAGSFGITGMKERALLLQGKLGIYGIPGKGTTVSVTLPIDNNVLRS